MFLAILCVVPACDSKDRQAGKLASTLFKADPSRPLHSPFSAAKAMAHVQAQVDIGPRPSGSPAIANCRALISKHLQEFGWKVEEQKFTDSTPRGQIEFANIRARLEVTGSDTWNRPCLTLLGSHFDTKYFGGVEFVGANDAGSSTGVLMEMARILAQRPDAAQMVELVFFDGEEATTSYGSAPLPTDGLHGSRHYVTEMIKWPEAQRPVFLILLDMVGDADLKIEIPTNTSPFLRKLVLDAAAELNHGRYFAEGAGQITDDHVPFNFAGVQTVDIIDLTYPAWHTSLDKMNKISETSLDIVGKTTLRTLEMLLSAKSK